MKIGMTHFYWKSYSDVELERWVVFHTMQTVNIDWMDTGSQREVLVAIEGLRGTVTGFKCVDKIIFWQQNQEVVELDMMGTMDIPHATGFSEELEFHFHSVGAERSGELSK